MSEDLDARSEAFTKEAYEFCLKAADRKIKTVICFVIEDDLSSTHRLEYTGSGMTLFETIGVLESQAFALKMQHLSTPDE